MALKKVLSLGLAATMSMAMGLTAFASSSFWTEYPNLTNYNTAYNTIINQNTGGSQDLMVQATSAYWYPNALFDSAADAASIGWTILNPKAGVTTTGSGSQLVNGKYSAKTTVNVAADTEAGVVVVEADNKSQELSGYMDFSVIVNPSTSADDVAANVRIYTNNTLAASGSGDVAWDGVRTAVKYPSAMDAAALPEEVTAVNGSLDTLTSMTIDGTTYENQANEDGSWSFWTYCVYDAEGKKVDLTAKVGAEAYDIDEGDTVVWVYGTGYTFPAQLSQIGQ